MSGIRVVVCGSRSWTDEAPIRARLEQLPPCSFVMHGGARGVDRMASVIAQQLGHAVRAFPADWKGEGRRAGILRNLRMLDQVPELVLAFWDGESRGTRHMIEAATARGIHVEVA